MKKTIASCVAALSLMTAATAFAAPDDKPLNAANPESGTGCFVQGGDGNYALDASCTTHSVVKRDKTGGLLSFRYHDHGTVQAGQPLPDQTIINDVLINLGGFTELCTGREVITPSGTYTSDLTCTN